jgi:hypothetical protein
MVVALCSASALALRGREWTYFLKDDVVDQREIVIQNEMADIFVKKRRLDVDDRIFLEGIGQVHEL